jgi:hypothetical protein
MENSKGKSKEITFPEGTYYLTYCFHPGTMGPITKFVARSTFNMVQVANIEVILLAVFSCSLNNIKVEEGYTRVFYISTDEVTVVKEA